MDDGIIPRRIFQKVLSVVKTLSRESGLRCYPRIEAIECSSVLVGASSGVKEKRWRAIRFPVIRTATPERFQEWEYFTLGYDPTEGRGMWWYIFSGSGGCYFSHPLVRNPFNDDLGKPHFGCTIIENIDDFVVKKLKGVLYDYTCTMPLEHGEFFVI